MTWYLEVLSKYGRLAGRARRMEYWMFMLINMLVGFALSMFAAIRGGGGSTGMAVIAFVYWLAVFIPSFAVGVRRLHDIDRSGWWTLIGIIPIIGGLVLLVFSLQEGTLGPNAYGPDPKSVLL